VNGSTKAHIHRRAISCVEQIAKNGILREIWQRPGSQTYPSPWVLRPVVLLFAQLRWHDGMISWHYAMGKEISHPKSQSAQNSKEDYQIKMSFRR
jgi:hypothetical protein